MAVYVVDSNFFIQAFQSSYPMDVAKSFWSKVIQLANKGHIISIDKVEEELSKKEDQLLQWCQSNLPNDFFHSTEGSLASYAHLVAWADSSRAQYLPAAINEFLDADKADAFLIAFVMSDSAQRTLVTQEKSAPGSKRSIKIPEPCNAFNVRYVNMIEMFRELNESF